MDSILKTKEESFKSKSPEGGKRDSFLGQRASDWKSALN